MTVAKFEVIGPLDGAGGPSRGTVLIDRTTNIFYVRPLGMRRMYSLPLGDVATMVCRATLAAEVRSTQKPPKKVSRRRP